MVREKQVDNHSEFVRFLFCRHGQHWSSSMLRGSKRFLGNFEILLRGFRHLLWFEAYELTAQHNHVRYWDLKLQLTLRVIAYQSLL